MDTSPVEAEILLVGGQPIDLQDFPKLKGIFKCGVGRDNVPEDHATQRGIICGFPSPASASIIFDETACFASHLVLQCMYAQSGIFDIWKKISRDRLASRQILVIGNGNIGSRVVKKLENFAEISTFDTISNQPDELEKMVRQADCITLHLPLNSCTKDFFNAEKISWMKDGASLVNTARAPLVAEEDLYQELLSGRIRAAFDVFWQEPYKGKLTELPKDRFMRSPHIASNCVEFLTAIASDFRQFISSLSFQKSILKR